MDIEKEKKDFLYTEIAKAAINATLGPNTMNDPFYRDKGKKDVIKDKKM